MFTSICTRSRKVLIIFSLLTALNPSRGSAGIADLDPGHQGFYIQYLLFVFCVNLPRHQIGHLINSFTPNNNEILSYEQEALVEQLNLNLPDYDDEIFDAMLAYQQEFAFPLTLATNDVQQFQITWEDYQALRAFSPIIANMLPAVPFPQEPSTLVSINLPGAVLRALIKLVSSNVEVQFPNANIISTQSQNYPDQLEGVITEHVANENHRKLISIEGILQILEFMVDLDQLRGTNQMLFREDDFQLSTLYNALLDLLEDYWRLLAIVDPHTLSGGKSLLLSAIAIQYRNDPLTMGAVPSHYENQMAALAYIRKELMILCIRWSKKLTRPTTTQSVDSLRESKLLLQKVLAFFKKHDQLMRKIDDERFGFIAALKPICQTSASIDFQSDLEELEKLAIQFEEAEFEAKSEKQSSIELKIVSRSSSTKKFEGVKTNWVCSSCPGRIENTKKEKKKDKKKKGFFF